MEAKIEKMQEMFNKHLEELKNKQTEMNNTITEMKNTLEGINRRITEAKEQISDTWRLNNMCLNNQEITEEIKEEIKKYLETNYTKNMMIQNLWDTAKAVLRGKFIAIQAYLKKQEKSQINNLTLHLK